MLTITQTTPYPFTDALKKLAAGECIVVDHRTLSA